MSPGRLKGCTRGVFGLTSWDPLPRPGDFQPSSNSTSDRPSPAKDAPCEKPPKKKVTIQEPEELPSRKPMQAKYSYKANRDSPLGTELDVTMGEILMRIQEHPDNHRWLLTENSQGEVGYVPTSYMAEVEVESKKVSSLPWLPTSPVEDEDKKGDVFGIPDNKPYKPYQSAYNHGSDLPKKVPQYYCDVCEKEFNGPKPLQAHLFSKLHKEEVALREGS